MPQSENGGRSYHVEGSGIIAKALRRIQHQANEEGRGVKVLAAIRHFYQRLRKDPSRFGEELYRLPAMRMQIRCAVVLPLVVHFGVCEDRPTVYLKGVKLLPEPAA